MPASQDTSERTGLARRLTIALLTPVILLVATGFVLGRQILIMADDAAWVDHSDEVIGTANEVLRQVVDQETAVRGFLLTRDRAFLEPFERAHPLDGFARLHDLTTDNPGQQRRFDDARREYERWHVTASASFGEKLEQARQLDELRERKAQMDALRGSVAVTVEEEARLRRERVVASEASTANAKTLFVVLFSVTALALALLSRSQLGAIARTFGLALDAESRSRAAVEEESWIRAGQARLAEAMQGDVTVAALGEAALGALAEATGAELGAFFTSEGAAWRRRAGFGLDARAAGLEVFPPGEGLVGRAAARGELLHVTDVPGDAPKIRSGTTDAAPREIVLVPARIDGGAHAVVELAFARPCPPRAMKLLERIGESIAGAVRSAESRQQTRELLEETQRQAEELQTQQEELRVANEELEAQTTALRVAQKELEAQRTELEATNDDLSAQKELLERQNRRLGEAQEEVSAKAREVERASQFKSEFLSNMSHELRTPLNSSLIMAKLLADNRHGNLTDEQVKFAETIYSAGNDLLALINDVLDLSKIEAGKMDVRAGPIGLERLRTNLTRTFEPVAAERHLRFAVELDPAAPKTIETDAQRLEQILKNLISNALKFTERGEVVVHVSAEGDRVRFSVRDTGIGIPSDQLQLIFDAFRQVDATANRKYGGTGLGLSISRELARLLGGEIAVQSVAGAGSTFSLVIPAVYAGSLAEKTPAPPVAAPAPAPLPAASALNGAPPEADIVRDPSRRLILAIEDDEAFARILVSAAEEAGFQCVVAPTGAAGLRLAKRHPPLGILLDMRLPDHSGLSVLDRLKRDPATRHIPVHVISVSDFVEQALSMGAVAYLLKPVGREQLVEAFQKLERQSQQQLRRVLVVEDDDALRENVAKLLGREGVEIATAGNVAQALALLEEKTFDCVVTDLALPGKSGYELIETMATEGSTSVPPVIVYTGRALAPDEEQRLRKYSKSIILKGARSPERLLDEVTLFLHQVEAELPADKQRLLREARHRESVFEDRNVLVVEDDVRNVFALTSVLEPKGARVTIARNGKEALAALGRDEKIDLVLMDVMMPEMDGLTAMREIRKQPRFARLPIIALTAKATRTDQETCIEAGANDYLSKPLDVEMLLSLIRVWMPK